MKISFAVVLLWLSMHKILSMVVYVIDGLFERLKLFCGFIVAEVYIPLSLLVQRDVIMASMKRPLATIKEI